MTTRDRPDEHDESDGQVRHLLWRLRARLVSPPREQQVEDDLSRLLEAARDSAHGSPSTYATSQPGPDAAHSRPQFPLVPTAEDELGARRAGRIASVVGLGRMAAASVAALVLGVGVSSAAGGPVTFDVIFGGDREVAVDEVPDPTIAAPLDDGADDDDAAPEADGGSDEADGFDGEVEEFDAPEPEFPGPPDIEVTFPEDDEVEEPAGDGSTSDDDGAVDDVADEVPDLPDEADDGGEILAGPSEPPNDTLDGFGGGQQCEDDDLASCLTDEETEGGPTLGDTDSEAEADELASRRYRPDDEDDPETDI